MKYLSPLEVSSWKSKEENPVVEKSSRRGWMDAKVTILTSVFPRWR
jgi:hypothetical protein